VIHLNFGNGKGRFLTEIQLQEEYPKLYEIINEPKPHKESADMLKRARIDHRLTLREMAKRIGCPAAVLSRVETGRDPATSEQVEAYQRLRQEPVPNDRG